MITVGLYGIADTTSGAAPTYTHDHGVAVLREGRVLAAVELERITGRKHDNRLPHFITALLERLVPPDEPVRFVSVNSFVGSAFVSGDGNLRIEPRGPVPISSEPVPADVYWFPDGRTRRPATGFVVCHELAHVASHLPFIGRFVDGALAVHIDGGASRSACSFWDVVDARPRLRQADWGLLKDVVNNFNASPIACAILGFAPEQHLSIPGRLMGYAGLGEADPSMARWLRAHRWFLEASVESTRAALQARFGPLSPRNPTSQALCACLQAAFQEDVVREIAVRAKLHDHLYLAGGAALNIPTNAALQAQFGSVWVPPATSDAGLALGAAAWIEYLDLGELPIHGPFLNGLGVPVGEPSLDCIEATAALLMEGAAVGICNGAAEIGPRALGHRSIVSRADDPQLRIRVSENIKRREWYRPVAPALCEAAAREVLDDRATDSPLSRFMLGAWQVRPEWRDRLAGVLHADGTVRAQVVRDDGQNRWFHALLQSLWERHGIPALINTSFNGPGTPIVHEHAEARPLATAMGLDAVVVHGSLHRR